MSASTNAKTETEGIDFIADFNKDATDSAKAAMAFYERNGWGSSLTPQEMIRDKAQVESLSNGKGKDLTVIWIMGGAAEDNSASSGPFTGLTKIFRFIVLTREKGGALRNCP